MKLLIPIVFAAVWLQGCDQPADELPGVGQWRVVNYWAIWCTPCREEIPELNALNDSTELMVFAVNYDGQTGEALLSQAAGCCRMLTGAGGCKPGIRKIWRWQKEKGKRKRGQAAAVACCRLLSHAGRCWWL